MTGVTSTRRHAAPSGNRVGLALRRWDVGGWLTTAGVTAVAAALRLPALGRPPELVFDETYYVKDAWTLLNLGYEAQWPSDPDPAFEAGQTDGYLAQASYVVHPAVGKWVIAAGLRLFGADDPVGWRIGVAVAGLVTVLLLTRVARRLFASTAWGATAGLLVALDGSAIVNSRTALLDGVLTMWVVAAFAALLVDRDRVRARLAAPGAPPGTWFGPGLGLRPWRLLAGVLLGLAVGTKWSGLWFLAAFGLLSVAWDAVARYRAQHRRWWQATLLRDAGPAAGSLVGVAALTYLGSWLPWFRSAAGYGRQWATTQPASWVPDALRSWWHYHGEMYRFHTGLTADHVYTAHPVGWLVQWRPTAYFYASPEPAQQYCGADHCSQAVTSLGNPFIWWFAAAAVVAAVWWAVRRRDGVAAAALSGVVAGWIPWFAYADRPVFTFYAVAILPWLALTLTWAARRLLRWSEATDHQRSVVTALVVAGVLIVATTAFFWPLWNAQVVPLGFWQLHQWLPSWV